MNTNNFSRKNSRNKENIILSKIAIKTINRIARLCGYIQRNTGKISIKNLMIGFMIMVSKQRNTYTDWAIEIGLLMGKSISKQALNERMKPETELFVKRAVEEIISKQTPVAQTRKIKGILKHFNEVKIDDSTTINLPTALAKEFPGNVSRGEKKAQAKIHAMYNLKQNNFSFCKVHSFANNDQSLSAQVLPYLNKGDLSIRDLGFTVLEVVSKFNDNGIYFIARKGYSSKVFDAKAGHEIDLLKILRKKKFIDMEVLVSAKHQVKVRLIALPIPPEQAEQRRRKARTDRDARLNHSQEYYELLGYSIYITNISPKQCNAEEIFLLYKLRWRIEIIFKSWKSCFSLEKIIHHQCTNAIRVNCIIYLMLLYIFLFYVVWWNQCESEIEMESLNENISILKLARFFNNQFIILITSTPNKEIMEQIKTHCTYHKRKDRVNTKQFQFNLAA